MIQQISNEPIVIALCPEKFFKIHRIHLIVRLIAHAVALDLPIIDPQYGTAADYIKAAINGKEFQCGGDIREFLELVKEEQSLSWQKSLARVQTGNILDDLVRLIAVGCDELVLGLLYEIDIDHIFVAALGKTLDRLCLAHLPGSLDNQRFVVRGGFPLCQK